MRADVITWTPARRARLEKRGLFLTRSDWPAVTVSPGIGDVVILTEEELSRFISRQFAKREVNLGHYYTEMIQEGWEGTFRDYLLRILRSSTGRLTAGSKDIHLLEQDELREWIANYIANHLSDLWDLIMGLDYSDHELEGHISGVTEDDVL